MRKFGEISIFNTDGFKYRIYTTRYIYKQRDIPWVVFCLTRKTAKRERRDLYERSRGDAMFRIFGKIPVSGIRKILKEFKEYLDSLDDETLIAITAESDSFKKRICFYEKQMLRAGWIVCDILNETFYTGEPWFSKYKKKVLIFRRKL